MTSTFHTAIRRSISNEALQIALDNNARRRVSGRLSAFASLPDWRERRTRAHAVRAEVIGHLDEYLEKFTQQARHNGLLVQRAENAAEAVQQVVQIAEAHHARLIAKSKSMVSEEIELNRALELDQIRVVETDLGEYIVQLRGEKPAHIITPAVHLRRHEVGQLFQAKLGLPYTEDIGVLTDAARKILREVFLTAQVGVSGVNFGVAETGTICIVTNEGNGRMVTTLPPVHIALMGMERILPGLPDLALMLSLLPRSATGQKLSAYTQLIHSPRRAGELDGALERHLIIVDNGRSRLQHSRLQEALYCIRCGACLNACPVFRELGGHAYVGRDGAPAPYPGPIGSIVSPGLLGLEQFGQLAQASSLCGACQDACPVEIDLPKLLTRVRAGEPDPADQRPGVALAWSSRAGLKAYGWIASSPKVFAAAQRLAGLLAHLFWPFSKWIWIPAFTGWGYSKDLPRPAVVPFHARWKSLPPAPARGQPAEPAGQAPPDTRAPGALAADPLDRFAAELTALGGSLERVAPQALNDRLIDLLKARGIEAVAVWEAVEGVDALRLEGAGIRLEHGVNAALRAGITGAAAAIAETGTLVLASGPGKPLTASLLPELHIALLQPSQIVTSLEQALQQPALQAASTVTLITGPSRTADIEMTLTIGVHGPKDVHVFLLEAAA